MDISEMADSMCESLSDADVRQICRERAFVPKETATRGLLAQALLSEVGVVGALARLSADEKLCLLRLSCEANPVDLEWFSCIYRAGEAYETFTQRFRPVFKQVQENLVRRGLMVFCEGLAGATQLERLFFALPPAFHRLLPLPFEGVARDGAGAETPPDPVRQAMLGALTGGDELTVDDGRLSFCGKPFSALSVRSWSDRHWAELLGHKKAPIPAVFRVFERLPVERWLPPNVLQPLLDQYGRGEGKTAPVLDAEAVCDAGFRAGALMRNGGHYRLFTPDHAASPTERSLRVLRNVGVEVDLSTISVEALEALAVVSHFETRKRQLVATPDRVGIGRTLQSHAPPALAAWLREASPPYRNAFLEMEKRLGHQVVHENLSFARIRDLAVRTQLTRTVAGVVAIGGEFVAFPKGLVGEVERFARKNGLAPRKVQADR